MSSTAGSAPTTDVSPGLLRRAIGASAIGNATEWFDYGIYAYGVTYISAAFFPGSAEQATLFALATFAISFLVRPLGGLFWGPLGDKIGRRAVLAMTIIIMSIATVCIGLVPSYDSIGLWATALVIGLRMVQGFSTGGEYGGAATFMAEYSPDNKRGLCGSFLEVGTLAGFSLGAISMLVFSLVLSDSSMQAWGWRIPFYFALPLGLIGLYLRSRLEDTPVFRELEAQEEPQAHTPFKELLTGYAKPLILLFGLVLALNVVNYTLLSYMPTYLEVEIGLSSSNALLVPIVGMLAMTVLLPFAGALSDRVGRKPMWWFSLIGLMVMVIPMYLLMATNFVGAMIAFAVLGLLYIPQLATISATFPAMFPTHVRYAGVAIAYNVSTSAFGGTAPLANDALIGATGSNLVPAFYMIAACAIGAVALYFVTETVNCSIRGTDIPGSEESIRNLSRDVSAGRPPGGPRPQQTT